MPVVQFNRRKQFDTADPVRSFESPTAEIIGKHQPLGKRSVLYLLATLIVLLMIFISVAHLERVVTASGRLIPVTGALTVQPLDKSIISSILVSVGDIVKKGQVLATMDATFVHADVSELEQKVASLAPQRRRIESEEAGQPFRVDRSQPFEILQDSISQQRATEFESGVRDLDERIRSAEADVAGLK